MCKILCPKCLSITQGTKHHIYPKRFFGNGKNADNDNTPLLYLCRKCHSNLERLIPQHYELDKEDYLQIAREFLYFDLQQPA